MSPEECQHKLVKLRDSNGKKISVCLDCDSAVLLDTGYAQIGLVKNGLYREAIEHKMRSLSAGLTE